MRSSGLGAEDFAFVLDKDKPLAERWKVVEPFWENARHTGYGRAIDKTVKGLYGIERLDGTTLEKANELFLAARQDNPYRRVLREKSNIRTSLADNMDLDSDKNYFTPVYKIDAFLYLDGFDHVKRYGKEAGVTVTCFDDWLNTAEYHIAKAIAQGVTVFKCGMAYVHSLNYEKSSYNAAEEEFNRIFKYIHLSHWVLGDIETNIDFRGYMMHYLLRIISRHGLTVQFHTGLLEGNGNTLAHSNPELLNNLFLLYPDVKFDLFHISYPYQRQAIALCKMFPNVFLDMCWAHIISPQSSKEFLSEVIDALPLNKVSAFGGDYAMPDPVYGHQLMARENVSAVLADKVKEGIFNTDRACTIAKMLFFDNPVSIFNLKV